MPVDLATQTRNLLAAVDQRQEPIDLAEIITLAETIDARALVPDAPPSEDKKAAPPPSIARRQWRRNIMVAVAAAIAVLLAVGGVALVARFNGSPGPADHTSTTQPQETTTTTTLPAPETLRISIPESLTRPQMEHQAEFLDAFRELGHLDGGGCGGSDPGPHECSGIVYSPTLGGPVTLNFTVTERDSGGRDPGEVSGPDDMQQSSLYAAAVRSHAEDGLAALYLWALDLHPEATESLCRVGFSGDDNNLAWTPGYIADFGCGQHLANLIYTFNPAEAPPARELGNSEVVGRWYPVAGVLSADPDGWDDVLFDFAATPFGFIGTTGVGLFISQDGTNWEPFARDIIEFPPGSESFARVASSALGVLVVDPIASKKAWHTTDGENWQEVELAVSTPGSWRVAASDEIFVVAADNGIWTSPNGIDWVQSIIDPAVFAGGVAPIFTLEATPFGFVAGGGEQSDGRQVPVIWHSTDGIQWTRAPVLGHIRPQGDWIYDLAGSELGVVAVGKSGAIWYSEDGADWAQVLAASPNVDWADSAVGASGTGFIVAAGQDIGPEIVVSADGIVWNRVEPSDGTEEIWIIIREALPLGDGFLVATEGGSSPVHIYEP